MSFCNSCGSPLAPGAQACAKCGIAVAAAGTSTAAPLAATPAPGATPTPKSSALKVILIVGGAVLGIVIICAASLAFIVYRVATHSHITQNGDNVKVETPFGSVETTKDPAVAAKNLGVDVYPGAEVQRNGAASATIGGIHTVAASFESPDSPDKICKFYESKFPNATVKTSDAYQCTIVSTDQKNVISINVASHGGNTQFQISNVTRGAAPSTSGPNSGSSH
jgi:hypothetical protein